VTQGLQVALHSIGGAIFTTRVRYISFSYNKHNSDFYDRDECSYNNNNWFTGLWWERSRKQRHREKQRVRRKETKQKENKDERFLIDLNGMTFRRINFIA
jgi:hypothetical protein